MYYFWAPLDTSTTSGEVFCPLWTKYEVLTPPRRCLRPEKVPPEAQMSSNGCFSGLPGASLRAASFNARACGARVCDHIPLSRVCYLKRAQKKFEIFSNFFSGHPEIVFSGHPKREITVIYHFWAPLDTSTHPGRCSVHSGPSMKS